MVPPTANPSPSFEERTEPPTRELVPLEDATARRHAEQRCQWG